MLSMKRRVLLSILVGLISIPIVIVLLSGLWKIGVFDYDIGLNNVSLYEWIYRLIELIFYKDLTTFLEFTVLLIFPIIFYWYYFYYKEMIKNEYTDKLITDRVKEVMLALLISLAVYSMGYIVPGMKAFAACFVPSMLILLTPCVVYLISMKSMGSIENKQITD